MMKKFILIVCGSFVGTCLAFLVFTVTAVVFSFAMVFAMDKSDSAPSVKSNSILYIDLAGTIDERDNGLGNPMLQRAIPSNHVNANHLDVLLSAISNAKDNSYIDGIYLDCDVLLASPATRSQLRQALADFKKSGKFIYAYGDSYEQGDYYLASVADSVFLNPAGAVDIHGLAVTTEFYKKFLSKIGVKMQVIRVGQFKSAVEPYLLDSISPANRLQQQRMISCLWNIISSDISKSRNIPLDKLNKIADGLTLSLTPTQLVANKIVDKLYYRNQFEDMLREKTGVDKTDDLNLVYPQDIAGDSNSKSKGKRIAILYAEGEIDGPASMFNEGGIDSEELVATLRELTLDDDIKGLVLRVNSPGGSAFGSEQIWKAIEDFKASGKPVAVSMGDYAASGGYYISCGANRIFAQPNTITGSIGIFGVIPSIEDLYTNKLGITQSVVKTNENADFGTLTRDFTPAQLATMQNVVNFGYETFVKRCSAGRQLSADSIKAIAQGRVWTGEDAKRIGLVDEFGDLAAATKWVAGKAKLGDNYKTDCYPKISTSWMRYLDQYMEYKYNAQLKSSLGLLYDSYVQAARITSRKHVLCLMQPISIQ